MQFHDDVLSSLYAARCWDARRLDIYQVGCLLIAQDNKTFKVTLRSLLEIKSAADLSSVLLYLLLSLDERL